MNNEKITLLAETNFRNQKKRFGIKIDDRRRHMYLIGKTGMGKSTVLENMIIQDIRYGRGVALIDPHGDFAEKLLDFIPVQRINDVVYFNPCDTEFPIAFNVMETVSVEHKHLVASGLVGVFKKLWADSWGPRLEYVLRNAILALLDYPGSTLLGVMRILTDKTFRKKVIAKIKDPVVKAFWVDEYSNYPDRFQAEAIAPIQNKVGQFLSTALIRNVVGQVKSNINLRETMDEGKILIMNLSKGRIGEDASALLGAMMITKIQLAAMSRIDTPEVERKDFYLYVDEFQNFATESFANILSEARKYRLNLIIAHQYIEQLGEVVQPAVFGNVGTIMCFRVGAGDAEFLVKEFTPYFNEEDLVNLTKYDIYMKLMIDGVSSSPFSATTLPPLAVEKSLESAKKIIRVSRERYASNREAVEDKISRWSGMEMEKEGAETLEPMKGKQQTSETIQMKDRWRQAEKKDVKQPIIKKKSMPTVSCYECGQRVMLTFKPDGVRPVYCKKCFQKIRERFKKNPPEVRTHQKKEISLQEALSKGPISFSGKGHNEKKRDEKEIQDQNPTDHATISTLSPGQVVKF